MERLPGVEAFTLGGAIRAAQLHTVLDYPSAPILESFPLIRLACHPKLKWLWRFSYSVRPRGIEFIPRYIPHGKILSVGFGGIAELESLRKLGWEVWGIDVDEELVRGARENGFSASVAPSISDAGLPDNSFDAVLMSHVLEHLSDPFTEIAEVMRVLKPGGLFQVVVPRHDSLYASLFGRNWIGWDVPRHLVDFDTRQLRESLVKAGFSIVSISSYSTVYGPAYGFVYAISENFHAHYFIPKFWSRVLLIPSGLLYVLSVLVRRGDNLCVVARK
jgi:2-polyprenyl-3-methyl-5-hydroxy-6-metoxy-1,4-benzoquinol methylase